jgi:hypothetical protein
MAFELCRNDCTKFYQAAWLNLQNKRKLENGSKAAGDVAALQRIVVKCLWKARIAIVLGWGRQ